MADSTITLRVVSEEVGSAPASSAHASPSLSAPPSAPSAGNAKGVHTGFNAPAIPPQATRTAGAGAGGAGGGVALDGAGGARLQSLAGLVAGLALHQGFSALTGALGTIPGQKRTAGKAHSMVPSPALKAGRVPICGIPTSTALASVLPRRAQRGNPRPCPPHIVRRRICPLLRSCRAPRIT